MGKDASPGPKREVKFTPSTDEAVNVKFVVRNRGPGTNKVTLEAKSVLGTLWALKEDGLDDRQGVDFY